MQKYHADSQNIYDLISVDKMQIECSFQTHKDPDPKQTFYVKNSRLGSSPPHNIFL